MEGSGPGDTKWNMGEDPTGKWIDAWHLVSKV